MCLLYINAVFSHLQSDHWQTCSDCIHHQSDLWQAWWLYLSPIRPLAGMVTVFIANQTTGRHGDCIHHQSDHWQAWWLYSSPIRPLAGMVTVFITNQTTGRHGECIHHQSDHWQACYCTSPVTLLGGMCWLYSSPIRPLAGTWSYIHYQSDHWQACGCIYHQSGH